MCGLSSPVARVGTGHVVGILLLLVTMTLVGKPTFLPLCPQHPRCFTVSGISKILLPLGSGPIPKAGLALVAISCLVIKSQEKTDLRFKMKVLPLGGMKQAVKDDNRMGHLGEGLGGPKRCWGSVWRHLGTTSGPHRDTA